MKYSVITSAYNQLEEYKKIIPAWEAQTVQDFELIVADDGSSDGLRDWLMDRAATFPVKYHYQKDNGYRYFKAMREASKLATGEYIVYSSGDAYPHPEFLEELGRSLKPDRMVCGKRVNIRWDTGKEIIDDWRLSQAPDFVKELVKLGVEIFPVTVYPYPWVLMTQTGMALPRSVYNTVGGLRKDYDDGYGKGDWSLALRAFKSGCGLWYNTAAKLYHKMADKPTQDTKHNSEVFQKELKEYGE